MTTTVGDYARKAMWELQKELGDRWDALGDKDRALLFRCFRRAGAAQLQALAGKEIPKQERADISAQIAGITSGSAARIEAGFWEVVKRLAEGAWSVVKTFIGVK